MEQDPFPDLNIDSASFLDELDGRSKCSKCQKSRKFYCYTCCLPVPEISEKVPHVKLPLKVDIIKHPGETDGKSTAVHAGVLVPEDVTIYTYPCIPDYDRDKVVIVFPNESSKTLHELANKWRKSAIQTEREDDQWDVSKTNKRKMSGCDTKVQAAKVQKLETSDLSVETDEALESAANNTEDIVTERTKDTLEHSQERIMSTMEEEKGEKDRINGTELGRPAGCPLERVVFIDSTWNQTKSICNDERLKGLQCVELRSHKTKFWRHQKDIPDTYLSTIEAIYYFLREFHDSFISCPYKGQYDNLLFFFKFMYNKIRNMYDGGDKLKAYKNRRERQSENT